MTDSSSTADDDDNKRRFDAWWLNHRHACWQLQQAEGLAWAAWTEAAAGERCEPVTPTADDSGSASIDAWLRTYATEGGSPRVVVLFWDGVDFVASTQLVKALDSLGMVFNVACADDAEGALKVLGEGLSQKDGDHR